MKGVSVTPLRQIPTLGGDVFHALKSSEESYAGFGEAYFSFIKYGVVKGWKRHRQMTMNLIVPCGSVRFMVHNDAEGQFESYNLSADESTRYIRLTVSPGLWMAFGGLGRNLNLVLNVASIEHDPSESEKEEIGTYAWDWGGELCS